MRRKESTPSFPFTPHFPCRRGGGYEEEVGPIGNSFPRSTASAKRRNLWRNLCCKCRKKGITLSELGQCVCDVFCVPYLRGRNENAGYSGVRAVLVIGGGGLFCAEVVLYIYVGCWRLMWRTRTRFLVPLYLGSRLKEVQDLHVG